MTNTRSVLMLAIACAVLAGGRAAGEELRMDGAALARETRSMTAALQPAAAGRRPLAGREPSGSSAKSRSATPARCIRKVAGVIVGAPIGAMAGGLLGEWLASR